MKKLLTLFTITALSSITVSTTANAIINHNNLINPTIDNKTDSNPELIGQLTFSQKNMKMGFEGIVENNNLFYGVMIKNQSISFYTINNKVGSSFTLVKTLTSKRILLQNSTAATLINNAIYYQVTVGRAEANNNISTFFKWDLSTNQITNLGTILINPRLSSWTTKANTISIFQYQNKIIFLYNKTWIDGSAIVVYDTSTGKLASLATAALIQTEIVNLNNHLYFIDSNNLLNVVNLNDLSIDNYQLGTIKNFVSVTSIDNQIYLLKQGDNYKENNTLYALTFSNHNAVLNKIYDFPYNTDINNSFTYKNSTYLCYMTLKQVNKDILIDFNVTQLANQKVLNTKTIYTLNIDKFKLRIKYNFNINSNKINLTIITPPLYSIKSIIEPNSYYISYNLDKNQVSTNTFTLKEPGTIKTTFVINNYWYNSVISSNNTNAITAKLFKQKI